MDPSNLKHVIFKQVNENDQFDGLNHGDLVIVSKYDISNKSEIKDHYRNAQIKFVCVDINANKKHLCDCEVTPNGLKCIPLVISSQLDKIEQIDAFGKKCAELKDYANIYKSIELDAELHTKLLSLFTGNRTISKSRKCYYFYVDPDEPELLSSSNLHNVAYIWHDNPNNRDVNDDRRFIQLSNDLDTVHIGEQPLYERDNEVVEFSLKFKKVYENLFENYLKHLTENTPLYASLVPKNPKDDGFDENSTETTIIFYFNKIEYNPNDSKIIDFIVTRSFDQSEEYKFHRKICTQYGPYQNTYLWVSHYNTGRKTDTGDDEYFLDLPSNLYRLLENA